MSRFDFNTISLSDSADISKVAENFTELETNGVSQTDLTAAINDLKTYIDNAILNDKKAEHPVGSLEFNTSGTNPSTYLGFGTWVAWGSGRVPVGIDTNDSNFNTTEKTGGSNSQSYTPAGTNKNGAVQNHTLVVNELPKHTHTGTTGTGTYSYLRAVAVPGESYANNHVVGYSGGSYTEYSNQATAHTHSFTTNTTGGNAGHNHGFTQPTFTGTAATISHLQKYITCYMWKRTA